MSDLQRFQLKIIIIDVIILMVLIILALFLCDDSIAWIKGYIFGGLIGILNFLLLGNTVQKAIAMPPNKGRKYTTTNYFIRYIIVGIVLFIALKADYLNTLSVIIGLLLIKYILYVTQIFGKKGKEKKIYERKED